MGCQLPEANDLCLELFIGEVEGGEPLQGGVAWAVRSCRFSSLHNTNKGGMDTVVYLIE